MGIQAFVPSGGGGTPGFDYIASVNMVTYNRSWAQSGAAGNYVLTSNNMNSGYVYFVGTVTTGGPLGKVIVVSHPFTRIDIVAPQGDFMSLYKAAVKSTTVFNNALAAFSSFPSIITSSGNFVLPNNALPLVNTLIVGGGGGGGGHHAGGGGGGGGIVKLTAYQAVGTTSVTVGAYQGDGVNQGKGGDSYFGNIYALGGGGGGHQQGHDGGGSQNGHIVANGGGAGGYNHNQNVGGIATVQTSSTGVGPGSFVGGHNGGRDTTSHGTDWHNRGGGGGGAGGAGQQGQHNSGGNGGDGHADSITGSSYTYSYGGPGSDRYGGHGGNQSSNYGSGGRGGHSNSNSYGGGRQGVVVVRYYIP